MEQHQITISFPALIHRIGGDQVKLARQQAETCGCKLKRVRRSRNWQASGNIEQFSQWLEQLKQLQALELSYLINRIQSQLNDKREAIQPLPERLQQMVKQNPNLTLAEMMAETGCTMAQARQARFDAES
ncbi:ribosome recycling factor family protein [Vibrio sp.]|uniref:ribosome recycling factor family protein n=1 Tax=Vibrio sp. TaxID=678 RepID=UPI003D101842